MPVVKEVRTMLFWIAAAGIALGACSLGFESLVQAPAPPEREESDE